MDPLITTAELNQNKWWLVKLLVFSVSAGLTAFVVTWLFLAWPTVLAEFNWYFGSHPSEIVLPGANANQVPSVTKNHLVISAISVDAPVIYDSNITDAVQLLPNGVVQVKGTAYPGETGNTFIIGHSSNYWWEAGAYNHVFTLLDKLTTNDQILINRNGVTYEYRVVSSEIVPPSAVQELDQPTDQKDLSIMTCTPVGTSKNRLIVHAIFIASN